MNTVEHLTSDLPDPESARRFLSSLDEKHPVQGIKLRKNEGLLSDVLTLAAYSPLLATTLLQNPDYLWWLNRKRRSPAVRTKDELLEALGRFVLTHTQLDLHTQLARFRRRELLRVFLGDIRRLATISEITEDISNLADAILETALRSARQQMDNRFGVPQAIDDKGRKTAAAFCIVSLGKLGSRELNYSSDIDLLFLYSDEGMTAGAPPRDAITNREYFVKLSEAVTKLVGRQAGEGAAYRVDMRLRPHGRVGPLAISVADAIRYYNLEARDWERQVLIRSRPSAGEPEVYKEFFEQVENTVFMSVEAEVNSALANVRRSKELIDQELKTERGFNVKLGQGGIREIEFIAQALQLAYGGEDRWLRSPHTLISLSRLADRGLITEAELTELFNAYEFLRHLEHILQMENGLQTHSVPVDREKRTVIGKRMGCETVSEFESQLRAHTESVHRIFSGVFADGRTTAIEHDGQPEPGAIQAHSDVSSQASDVTRDAILDTRQQYLEQLTEAIGSVLDFRLKLGAFRRRWVQLLDDVKTQELKGEIDLKRAKRAQTALAEASLDAALEVTRAELGAKYRRHIELLPLAIMGLGKLGGGAIDYGSDLDLVLVYDDGDEAARVIADGTTFAEFYSRAAEILVTTLSSMTRDGSIYRVDLRLRPYGKNGQSAISAPAFTGYMRDTSAIWEWLAYVKIRGVAGDIELARRVEADVREIIHSRAARTDRAELAAETHRVRMRLEAEKGGRRRSKDIDIKYGPGGMLDVYFAMRYLQLRDNIPDESENGTTDHMLSVLLKKGAIDSRTHEAMIAGYRFLSMLDHSLRLTVGRTTRLPAGNIKALDAVCELMQLASPASLIELLTIHRLSIREAFENVISGP